jgi:thioredoxin-like negative regulator of GroEL
MSSRYAIEESPFSDFGSPEIGMDMMSPGGRPREVIAIRAEPSGPNNGFAIAVLVISIVAIVVCILIVFLVKPCPKNRGKLIINVDDPSATGAAAARRGGPIEITSQSQLNDLMKAGPVMLMAHATWCGHCQKTKPDFAAATADILKACPRLKVAMMDGGKVKEALKPLGVAYFPFIAYFDGGKQVAEYKGNRSTQSFVDFAKKTCGAQAAGGAAAASDVQELGSLADLEKLVASGDSIVMFYAPWCGHCKAALPELKAAGAAMRKAGVKVAAIDAAAHGDAAAKFGVKGFPHTTYFRNGAAASQHTAFPRTQQSFVDFATSKGSSGSAEASGAATAGIVPEEPKTMEQINQALGTGKAIAMFYSPQCGHCVKTKPEFIAATAAMQQAWPGAHVVLINGAEEALRPALSKYEVPHFPLIRAFVDGHKVDDYRGPRTTASFVDYAKAQK